MKKIAISLVVGIPEGKDIFADLEDPFQELLNDTSQTVEVPNCRQMIAE